MIRKMEFKDIEKIKEIDQLCFKIDEKRTEEGIRGYIEASNNSSIVFEYNNEVVGYNFMHIWGSFAWFGPLGVHPEYQSKGIGKTLINETIRILKEDYKVLSIGLNTMPESQYNVGFYMNLGFTPLKLSLNLKKQIDLQGTVQFTTSKEYDISNIDIKDNANYSIIKEKLKAMSNKMFDNFDLTSELLLIKNESFGTIVTLSVNDKIHGIVICYTKSLREKFHKDLQIKLAIIDEELDHKKAIDCIIEFCSEYALKIGCESISLDCNTYNAEICNYLLLQHKFQIGKTQVMMLMGKINIFADDKTIILTRLAG